MAFIIAFYIKTRNKLRHARNLSRIGQGIRTAIALILLCSGNTLPLTAHAAEFHITSMETTLKNKVYHVSAKIKYGLSSKAEEALANGIPLLILIDIEVAKPRWWWWDGAIANLEQGYLLIYHALSENYIIHNLNSGTQENFVSLSRALETLGEIKDLPLLDANLLQADNDYYIRMRTYLDIESLPAPMQPIAYVDNDWQLESDWYEWPLQK